MALSEGTPVQLNDDINATFIRQANLSTDINVVLYKEATTFDMKAHVIDTSGGSISDGGENTVWSSPGNSDFGMDKLSSTKVIVANEVVGGIRARTMTVSGSTVTENSLATIDADGGGSIFVAMCSSTLGLVGYTVGGGFAECRICRITLSGDTISAGTPEQLDGTSNLSTIHGMIALDSTRVLIYYREQIGFGGDGAHVMVVDISSGISKGTQVQIDTDAEVTDSSQYYSCALVDTDKTAILYVDTNDPTPADRLSAIVVTTSGTTVSGQGTKYVVDSGDTGGGVRSIDTVDTSTVVICYGQTGGNDVIETLNVSGTTLSSNSDSVTVTNTSDGIASVIMIDTDQAIHAMRNQSNLDAEVSLITGFAAGCPTGQFYFGLGALTYKFDMPFGVQPHGMTLDQSLGTVVAGANCVDTTGSVLYSQFPYESYTLSDTGLATGTIIEAIKWI